jgi:hypothetical protein
MTHDELLAEISLASRGEYASLAVALIAVVKFHKPMLWKNLGNDTDGYKCQVCEGNSYPCPTIQAIEKGLE